MEFNTRNNVKVDLTRLEAEVRAKAAEYLDDITEENLKAFAESTKFIAQSVFEKFYFDIDDHYTDGVFKLQDEKKLNAFSDFHDGYRAKMRLWSNKNLISIREVKIDASLEMPHKVEDVTATPIAVAGVGTLIAVGLAIAGVELWVIVAAEFLALATATYLYKQKKNQSESDYISKVKRYEIQIELEKARLVNGLIQDLETWLKNAEKHSDSLLSSFGIN